MQADAFVCRRGSGWVVIFGIAVVSLLFGNAAKGKSIFDDDWSPPKRQSPPAPLLAVPGTAPATRPTAAAVTEPVGRPTAASTQRFLSRRPVPDGALQAGSRKLLKDVFAKQLADRSSEGRRKLARVLIDEATKAVDSPVDQFVLLSGAFEAGKECGALPLCFSAVNRMAESFAVDPIPAKLDAALTIRYPDHSPGDAGENILATLDLVDELLAEEDYSAAARVCGLLTRVRTSSATLRALVDRKSKEVSRCQLLRQSATEAVVTIRAKPADAKANAAIGCYLCFVKHQWDQGLAYLSRGNDTLLKAGAGAELAASGGAPASWLAAGDAWWTAADAATGATRLALVKHAAQCYGTALSSGLASGLSRSLAEQRVAGAQLIARGEELPGAPEWISQTATYTASSQFLPERPSLPNLLDGRGGGYDKADGYAFHTKREKDPHIIIDLGGPSVITGLEIANRNSGDRGRARTLTAWVAPDPAGPWVEVWRAKTVENLWKFELSSPQRARYLKLGLREEECLHLVSVKVMGYRLY
jgi:hypothetical protein